MLSVGRELKIRDRRVVCKVCAWRGVGGELLAGLLRIASTAMYSYAYRCPECLSFDLASPGKVLQFRKHPLISTEYDPGTPRKPQQAMP